MRVVLVHPAGSNWVPGQPDVTTAANRMPPIGLLSMAAHLEAQGTDVHVVDCLGPKAPVGPRANAAMVLSLEPDLVGFSTTTSGFLDAVDMARLIKEARPSLRTVFGGVHVSAVGPPLLDRFPEVDCLALGEGERTLAELVEAHGDPSGIAGLAFRHDGGVVSPAPREKIADLDALPFPAYHRLAGFPRGYHLPPFSHVLSPGATMITSRGCLYRCSYCDRSVFRKGFRYNSAEYVYDHMRYLRDRFGIRHVNVYDDLFTTRRKRIEELCERLSREPLGMQLNCAVRVGHADDDLLVMLKRAGCLMVSVGIESGDPEMLERHKSGVTLEEVRDTVARVKAARLRVKGLFMMGLPGETEASIRRSSDFVLSLGLDDMNMAKFTPFPGAPVWATIREHGDLVEDWRLMNCLNFVFVPKGIESKECLEELYRRHVKGFYSTPAWRRRFARRLWAHRRSMVHVLAKLPTFLAARRQFEPSE